MLYALWKSWNGPGIECMLKVLGEYLILSVLTQCGLRLTLIFVNLHIQISILVHSEQCLNTICTHRSDISCIYACLVRYFVQISILIKNANIMFSILVHSECHWVLESRYIILITLKILRLLKKREGAGAHSVHPPHPQKVMPM